MRLLLLLSALLSALTGVAGGAASARPVPSSIAVPATAVRVATVRAAPVGVPVAATWIGDAAVPLPRAFTIAVDHPLYASRRRE